MALLIYIFLREVNININKGWRESLPSFLQFVARLKLWNFYVLFVGFITLVSYSSLYAKYSLLTKKLDSELLIVPQA